MADVFVHDTETGNDYYVAEERFRNPPKKGLWERLDQEKPRTSVADAAAKKKATTGRQAESNQEEA